MQSQARMFTVDKFLGVNEAADGYTELKMGQAAKMLNWTITDGFNLSLRPGVQRLDFSQDREPAPILASWAGYVGDEEYLAIVDFYESTDRIFLYGHTETGGFSLIYSQSGALGLDSPDNSYVKVFSFAGKLYVMAKGKTIYYANGQFQEETPYIPKVITGASPQGGGTSLENLNLMSSRRRIDYSADGEATAYWLPDEATRIVRIVIDNQEQDIASAGSFDSLYHTFTFKTAPVKGVGNVEITYDTDAGAAAANRLLIERMTLAEAYNGSTDTRLFVAGDGTNLCYYTGVPESGELTATYFPAMNEVAVDMSNSPVTGLVRHYGKLLVFKPDGAFTITYEPVTLVDGKTIAGFFLRAANREFGSDTLGQIQTVENHPRTITRGGIYEWRITSSYYQDERNAKRVSDSVERSLQDAEAENIVTCDDTSGKTYYAFLNDAEGTVLVNRYALGKDGVWCVYKSPMFRNVRSAMTFSERMVFLNDTEAFYLDDDLSTDAAQIPGGEATAIEAIWESGYMDFGADFRRKYSSQIYVSMLPQSGSEVIVTAQTDRRSEYMEKVLQANIFSWPNANFPNWTFDVDDTPKIRRVRIKVKKFVYYKLIFKVQTKGAKATILGFDQQVRFSAMAK